MARLIPLDATAEEGTSNDQRQAQLMLRFWLLASGQGQSRVRSAIAKSRSSLCLICWPI